MPSWLKRYLRSPIFEDDEEKSRAARVLNALQLALITVTLLSGVASVLVFAEKLGSLAVVAGMAAVLTISRVLMYRGHVRSASILILTGIWLVVTGLVMFAGGMNSIDTVYYLSLTIIGGLLLGTPAMIVIAAISSLAGLAMALSKQLGYPLPQLFPVPPVAGWINFSFSLFLIIITTNIALNNLYGALALSRRRLEERRRAEQERERLLVRVQEQARQVQQVMDTVPEGVLLLSEEGRVLSANRLGQQDLLALANITVGNVLTQLGGRPLADLLAAPPRGLWHELETGGRSFQALARSIRSGEKSEGWVLVIRDVTQQKLIEQRSQQQERLAAVGQLAAGIAHDFNNIMAAIVLYAQMSLRAEDVSPKMQERLHIIHQQALHATQLIQQILDFSRRAVLERRPLDLLPLLKEQIKLLQRTLPENIAVTFNYGADEYAIHGSPTAIQQVLMNLAVNARDAMPNGGKLRFALSRLTLTAADPVNGIEAGEWIELAVADNGTGIPADVLPHIFDPFYTTKEPGMGTGLGLAQVYGIVGMHEGQIRVTTHPGAGTTFTLYLPALTTTPAPIEAETSEWLTGQGETILVVEDNPATRQALAESLKALNYQVVTAENGQQALTVLEKQAGDIALILSDVLMPTLGGIDLLRALNAGGLTTRLVLLTGHPLTEELETLRAEDAGGLLADWLLKPVALEKLSRVVARALSAKRATV
ncbi:MAG TPA: ATP-binding protein [Anaerolineae bacterium]|nr:ATP-binding protein [Anaerolineae bacterium]HQI83218.1 ATP-binding protein [Anaerolineae bacterium]